MMWLFDKKILRYALILLVLTGVVSAVFGAWESAAVAGFGVVLVVGAVQETLLRKTRHLVTGVHTVGAGVKSHGRTHQHELSRVTAAVEKCVELQEAAASRCEHLAPREDRGRRDQAEAIGQRLGDIEELHHATARKQLAVLRELHVSVQSGSGRDSGGTEVPQAVQRTLRELVQKEFQPQSAAVRRTESRLERAERKILGALETERMQSLDDGARVHRTLNELSERVAVMERSLSVNEGELDRVSDAFAQQMEGRIASLGQSIRRQLVHNSRETVEHTEALLQVMPKVHPRAPLPVSGGFAMDARALLHLSWIIAEYRPKRILELGGGASTIWMAYLTEGMGTEIVSIDHLEEYSAATAASVRLHGFSSRVECRIAPLEPVAVDGQEWRWYSPEAFQDVEEVDLLLVDGPPEATGASARYPALPLLIDKLASGAVVVLDDTHRDTEQRILSSWEILSDGKLSIVESNVSRLGVLYGNYWGSPIKGDA